MIVRTNPLCVPIVKGWDVYIATKPARYLSQHQKRDAVIVKESGVFTVGLRAGPDPRVNMTDSPTKIVLLQEFALDFVRNHIFLESFCEISVCHTGNKITGELGECR